LALHTQHAEGLLLVIRDAHEVRIIIGMWFACCVHHFCWST